MGILQPNYAINHALDGESKTTLVLTLSIFFGALSTIVVILRIYTRAKILGLVKVDDILMIITQIITIGLVIVTCLSVKYGVGVHMWMISPASIGSMLKTYYSTGVIYFVVINTVKLSILFQIRRVFVGRIIQLITLITIIFIILWTITSVLLHAFLCIPVSSIWDFTVNGKCLNAEAVYLTTSIVNLVADFTIFAIPLPVISTLNLSKRQKIITLFIFALGFFTCCISIIRLRIVLLSKPTPDETWDAVAIACWTVVEVACAIITACLPTLRPLVSKLMPSLFGTTVSKKYDSSKVNRGTKQSQNKSGQISETFSDNMFNTEKIPIDGIIKATETKIQISAV